MTRLGPLMQRNFLEYASYVVMDRAIPDLLDGLKPVQRRILHTLFEMHDGRFHKVANVIGETMKLHPHGETAIGDALVALANRGYFIERQGNFGNILTGHPAAAARYIECRLTPLALETLFFPAVTPMVPSYDGRKKEPAQLPAKLPVLLLLGADGIAVGMSTRILPHNFGELLKAQIDLLEGREARVHPDFPQGGVMDVSEYDDGRGRVRVRAKLEARGDKAIVITELPYSTVTESLIQSVEAAGQRGHVKIASIDDFTTEQAEIQVTLPRGVYAQDVIPQLYAYTDCEVSLTSSIVAIHDLRPVDLTVSQVLAALTDRLLEELRLELQHELEELTDRHHWLTLEQLFIGHRVYKRIEKARTKEAVHQAVWDGMHEHAHHFVRPMVQEDVERLLQIRIRRISAYDIEQSRAEVKEVMARVKECRRKLRSLRRTAVAYLRDLLGRYGDRFPRRTQIAAFESVDRRAVAGQSLKMSYDPESGFFGSRIRGPKFQFAVSEFDRILAISSDGSYRVMVAPEKVLLPGKVLYCQPFDPEKGASFTVVYRTKERLAYGKKVTIERFIKDKEYSLVPAGGRVDLLLQGERLGAVLLEFVPRQRQRVRSVESSLDELPEVGVAARGVRLAPKPVAKVTQVAAPSRKAAGKNGPRRKKRR